MKGIITTFILFITTLAAKDKSEITEFVKVCETGNLKKFNLMLKNNPDLINTKKMLPVRKETAEIPMICLAAYNGHLIIVKELLKKGVNLELRGDDPHDLYPITPLDFAAKGGHNDIIKFLLSKGAKLNLIHGLGYYHSVSQHSETVKFLCSEVKKAGLDSPVTNFFASAVNGGHIKTADFCLKNGANIEERNVMQCTPLMMAAWYDQLEMVKFLASKGADLHAVVEGKPVAWRFEGQNALHFAAEAGSSKTLEWLLSKGVKMFPSAGPRLTPLHQAASAGDVECIKLLLKYGAKVDELSDKTTPLHKSAKGGHTKACELLIKSGANIEAIDENGYSALHIAATYYRNKKYIPEHINCVKALLKLGAKFNQKTIKESSVPEIKNILKKALQK